MKDSKTSTGGSSVCVCVCVCPMLYVNKDESEEGCRRNLDPLCIYHFSLSLVQTLAQA